MGAELSGPKESLEIAVESLRDPWKIIEDASKRVKIYENLMKIS